MQCLNCRLSKLNLSRFVFLVDEDGCCIAVCRIMLYQMTEMSLFNLTDKILKKNQHRKNSQKSPEPDVGWMLNVLSKQLLPPHSHLKRSIFPNFLG